MLFKNYPIPRQATSQIKQRLLKQLHKTFLTNGVFQLFVQATYFLPIPRQTALHGFNKILMKPFIRILFDFLPARAGFSSARSKATAEIGQATDEVVQPLSLLFPTVHGDIGN